MHRHGVRVGQMHAVCGQSVVNGADCAAGLHLPEGDGLLVGDRRDVVAVNVDVFDGTV